MLHAYRPIDGKLHRMGPEEPLDDAIWVDLFQPLPGQVARLAASGVEVPTLEDMEEIEISNRLYHEGDVEYITVVLPGQNLARQQVSSPVCFIITPERLITVRHHAPRPFETYPERADKGGKGCHTPERVFLGLMEDIIGRLADILEGSGRTMDRVSAAIFAPGSDMHLPAMLQESLERIGREGEVQGRVRLALMTIERGISYFGQSLAERREGVALTPVVKGLMRDLQALEVHVDFLSQRVGLATDATLGMINLAQNATVRIVSVVAVLFLPPTLIASIYGMNFHVMPELDKVWGYPMALGLMLGSATATYLFFRWRRWL